MYIYDCQVTLVIPRACGLYGTMAKTPHIVPQLQYTLMQRKTPEAR